MSLTQEQKALAKQAHGSFIKAHALRALDPSGFDGLVNYLREMDRFIDLYCSFARSLQPDDYLEADTIIKDDYAYRVVDAMRTAEPRIKSYTVEPASRLQRMGIFHSANPEKRYTIIFSDKTEWVLTKLNDTQRVEKYRCEFNEKMSQLSVRHESARIGP